MTPSPKAVILNTISATVLLMVVSCAPMQASNLTCVGWCSHTEIQKEGAPKTVIDKFITNSKD